MTDPGWQRIKELFATASALPASRRQAYLDRECADDAELRREVESLLESHRPTRNEDAAEGPLGEGPGSRVGPYRLLEEIGEGGFGRVFLAEQDAPVRRRVALKVIKPGMDTRQAMARFEQERQALALMDHPGIARVFDGGETASGRPYFVMELVRGDPITDYCDREKLSTRERLELFVEVCRAVQHAHQKGVIHRDLKPSNVLVTILDGRPVPKVIDFGVAKATQGRLTEKTLFTEHRQMIGTPLYMSPEQAHLSGVDVDTRSDVYSLGVLLYELLTGVPPFDQAELLQAGIAEMHRMIRELEPKKPSTRVDTLGPKSALVAAQRRIEPAKLGLLLRGDLDWIAMRSLEKERARRYETASDLAQDVERHLVGEPVEAAPPSVTYRMGKVLRRNRGKAFAGAAVLTALALGLLGTTIGMQRAWAAEERTARAYDALSIRTEEAEWSSYAAGLLLAQQAIQSGDYPSARRSLAVCPSSRRGWEWEYVSRVAGSVVTQFDAASVIPSPDGSVVWTTWHNSTSQLRDLSGAPIGRRMQHPEGTNAYRARFSRDGRHFRTALSNDTEWIYDLSGTLVGGPLPSGGDSAFSPDGRLVLTLSDADTAQLWSLDGSPAGPSMRHAAGVTSCGFDPEGRIVLTTSVDGKVSLWNVEDGSLAASMQHGEPVDSAGFSPDGGTIWSVAAEGLRLWNLRGDRVAGPLAPRGEQVSAAFSPNGRFVLTWSEGDMVYLWDGQGNLVGEPMRHLKKVVTAVFSPDGQLVLTASEDGSARLWDLRGRPIGEPMWHQVELSSAVFTPDGQLVLTTVDDYRWTDETRLWDTLGRPVSGLMKVSTPDGLLPDGVHALSSLGYMEPVQLWVLGEREDPEVSLAPGVRSRLALEQVCSAAGHPDAARASDLAALSPDGHVIIDGDPEWLALRPPGTLPHHDRPVRALVVLPDGSRVVTAESDGTLRFWETQGWREIASLTGGAGERVNPPEIVNLEAAADGTRLVLRYADGSARILDVRSPEERRAEIRWAAAERGPAGAYVDELLSGATPTEALLQAVAGDASLPPLRRLVAAEVLEERLHGMEAEAEAALASLSQGMTRVEDLRSALAGASLHPRVLELLELRVEAWRPNGSQLNDFAWRRVSRPGAAAPELARAVAAARKAVELDPEEGSWSNTLGVALYRAGAYAEALDELQRARRLNSIGGVPDLTDVAYVAMCRQAVGDATGAAAELAELRSLAANEGASIHHDAMAAIAEAAALIERAPAEDRAEDR